MNQAAQNTTEQFVMIHILQMVLLQHELHNWKGHWIQ